MIPILIVVDGKTILESFGRGGTREHPIKLHSTLHKCVYMIGGSSFCSSLPWWSELYVQADPGDLLEWSMTAVDRNSFHPILVEFSCVNNRVLQTPRQTLVQEPYFIPTDPANPNQTVTEVWGEDVRMTAEVHRKEGFAFSRMVFKLLELSGEVIGYYSWDPLFNLYGN